MALYSYAISTDTLNGAVASSKLSNEIQASSIVVALEGVSSALLTDTLSIEFKATLSTNDQATLNAVVAAHDGNPGLDDPQKFTFVNADGDPIGTVDQAGTKRLALDFGQGALVGPQGEKGDKGDQGDPGPQGPAGLSPITGSIVGVVKSLNNSSTTSNSYQLKLELTTEDLPLGKYYIQWNMYVQSNRNTLDARIRLNNSSNLEEYLLRPAGEDGESDVSNSLGGFDVVELSGVNSVRMEFKTGPRRGTANIRGAKIFYYRLS